MLNKISADFAALQAQGTSTIIEKETSHNHTERNDDQIRWCHHNTRQNDHCDGTSNTQGQEVVVPGDISSAAALTAGAIMPESRSF